MPSEANSPTVRAGVYARYSSDSQSDASIDDQVRPALHLLSGLVHCGACGSRFASVGRDYLAWLRQRLMAPEMVEEFVSTTSLPPGCGVRACWPMATSAGAGGIGSEPIPPRTTSGCGKRQSRARRADVAAPRTSASRGRCGVLVRGRERSAGRAHLGRHLARAQASTLTHAEFDLLHSGAGVATCLMQRA